MIPPVVSLVGRPDSGKTTLLERLLPELKHRGLHVGTIKHHVHEFEMDRPGKDTWRHKRAGAHTVALSSPGGVGVIRDTERDLSIEELVCRYFQDADLVITEGYKRAAMPKIEVFRRAAHEKPLENRDETWVAFVSDVPVDSALPRLDLDDVAGLADFLVARFIGSAPRQSVTLLVDNAPIPLNPFVERFIRQSVLGMLTSLKGCRTPGEISLFIRESHDDSKK